MIIIPFWCVNVAAALLEVRTDYFVISTLIATIPGSLLYTTAGRGLANAFELYRDDISTWTLWKQVLFTNEIRFCLLLLLICGLFPMGIRYYNNKYRNNLSYTNTISGGKKEFDYLIFLAYFSKILKNEKEMLNEVNCYKSCNKSKNVMLRF
ncbi:hypothetical protein RFI_12397 [Reticulomyxa filosa]|uniref:Uncharacterized protein n=1 Tax=Reticulomyxa filosa TaxID=46433 RepID=X6NEK1_RETFI|nr:hypothetical protein RFI_12397 [Reticulomyxa filosa]|eukprot:ETO24760.1 hypothetical protein RFI_12397 [Reticulomyxa filosa]